jgi:hypothetical protein
MPTSETSFHATFLTFQFLGLLNKLVRGLSVTVNPKEGVIDPLLPSS